MNTTISALIAGLCVLSAVCLYSVEFRLIRRKLGMIREIRHAFHLQAKQCSREIALVEIELIGLEGEMREVNFKLYQLTRPREVEGTITEMIAEKSEVIE